MRGETETRGARMKVCFSFLSNFVDYEKILVYIRPTLLGIVHSSVAQSFVSRSRYGQKSAIKVQSVGRKGCAKTKKKKKNEKKRERETYQDKNWNFAEA